MEVTRVEADSSLIDSARDLMGERSASEIVNVALRRLIAAKQKRQMVDGIAELTELPEGLCSPVVAPAET